MNAEQSYKSCWNCCQWVQGKCHGELQCEVFDWDCWQKIPCPHCGGTLSEIRANGRRHCYSCHFEIPEGESNVAYTAG